MINVKVLVILGALFFGAINLACAQDYALEFGLVLHNDIGEPVGFEKTDKIPIVHEGRTSLFGVVVTRASNQAFNLNSVHVLASPQGDFSSEKVMGKPMYIQKRGAIFMRTELTDVAGRYQLELYIDHKLHQTIEYELLAF